MCVLTKDGSTLPSCNEKGFRDDLVINVQQRDQSPDLLCSFYRGALKGLLVGLGSCFRLCGSSLLPLSKVQLCVSECFIELLCETIFAC